jgi:hypothetical protein
MVLSPGTTRTGRPVEFSRNISAAIAFNSKAPKKEHFHEARKSLLGVWQTGNRRERSVLMVRGAEEVVLGSPRGDIESRSAFHDRVPGEAKAQSSSLTSVQHVSAEFGGLTRAFGGA